MTEEDNPLSDSESESNNVEDINEDNPVAEQDDREEISNKEDVEVKQSDDDSINAERPENESTQNTGGSVKKVKTKKYHAPLYIAACIFLAAILFFAGKQCFFNTDLDGTWGMTVAGSDGKEDMHFNLSFQDTEVRFQTNGTVYLGRLTKEDENGSRLTDENGNSMIMINMNLNGTPFLFKFDYEFTGNVFTGRTLKLTDLSGMFYEPEKNSDDEDVKKHKEKTGYIIEDDTVYYIWELAPSKENYRLSDNKDFKKDNKLTGSWLYKTEETAYPYTMTFNEDGTFEQLSYEVEIHGNYTAKDGEITLNWKELGNTERTTSVNYKVEGKTLTLSQDTMRSELKKTDDKYSFKTEIK